MKGWLIGGALLLAGCGIRSEAEPLPPSATVGPNCPGGSTWNGQACVWSRVVCGGWSVMIE